MKILVIGGTGRIGSKAADAQAPYFGAQLQEDTLVPVGQRWLGQQSFDGWLLQSGFASRS